MTINRIVYYITIMILYVLCLDLYSSRYRYKRAVGVVGIIVINAI